MCIVLMVFILQQQIPRNFGSGNFDFKDAACSERPIVEIIDKIMEIVRLSCEHCFDYPFLVLNYLNKAGCKQR